MTSSKPTVNRQAAIRIGARTLGALVAIALALPALALVAPNVEASNHTGPNVVIDSITFKEPPVVGLPTTVIVKLRNVGGSSYSAGASDELRMFWNESDLFGAATPLPGGSVPTSSGVYNQDYHWLVQTGQQVQEQIASTEPLRSIGVGGTDTFEFPWTPDPYRPTQAAAQAGPGLVIGRIHIVGGTAQPDDGKLEQQSVTVRNPAFSLQADFDQRSVLGDDIKKRCLPYPDVEVVPCVTRPGQVTIFRLNVTNRGNFEDSFNASTIDNTGSSPKPTEEYKVTFSPNPIVIPQGKSRQMLVVVEAPRTGLYSEAGRGINTATTEAQVRIQLKSETKETVEQKTDFPRIKMGQVYDFNFTLAQKVRVVNVTENVTFPLLLNNRGNGKDQFEFHLNKEKSSPLIDVNWTPTFAPVETFYLPRNVTDVMEDRTSKNMTFQVIPPKTVPKGRYLAWIEGRSLGDPQGRTCPPQPGQSCGFFDMLLAIDVYQSYALRKRVDLPFRIVAAGETASYPFHVMNDGNGWDNVTIRIENVDSLSGWRSVASTQRLTLAPFSEGVFYVNVTPPVAEKERVSMRVNVTVTSSGPVNNTEELRPRLFEILSTEVQRGPNVQIATSDARSVFVDANGSRSFDIRVSNLGNVWDNVTFGFERPLDWGVKVVPERVTLPPKDVGQHEKTVRFTITAPKVAEIGNTATITLRAQSEADEGQRREMSFTGRISGPDLYVSGLTLSKSPVYAGDLVHINATIGNRGNKPAPDNVTVRITHSSGGTDRTLPDQVLPVLGAGAARSISLPWNTTGLSGAGTIVVVVDPDTLIKETEEGNNQQVLSGDATFVRVFGLQLSSAQGLSGRPGERLSYQEPPNAFVLKNTGNRLESVKVSVASHNGWARYSGPAVLTLGEGQEAVIGFEVNIPSRPGVGEDRVDVRLEPVLRPSAALRSSIVTQVVDGTPPLIADVTVTPPEATLGTRVNLSATVTDAVGLKSVKAYVRTALGGTEEVPLTLGADDVWYAERAWTAAGEYDLYVEAVDLAKDPNRADTSITPTTFKLLPGSAPRITVSTDLTRPIRSGTAIELGITDPLGVARAYYVVADREVSIPRTWKLDTTNFTAGEVSIVVYAENLFGVKSSQPLSFVLDNSPPEVTSVEMTPSEPKAGEEVTIRITTEDEVEGVDVVVKRGGTEIETKAATQQGDGLFILTYTPAAGDYEFDVVAKDVAGNVRVDSGAVAFTTSGGFFGPTPGLLAGLAVLGAVAVLARRRR